MRRLLEKQYLLIALTVLGANAAVYAQDASVATSQLQVTASVVANCRLNTLPLDFGAYDPLAAHASQPLTATTDLTLLCTRDTPASISLDQGIGGATTNDRALLLGAERLRYQLFRDASRNQVWGVGADSMSIGAAPGISSPIVFPVYGEIFPGQEVLSGAYSDIITARVDF